MTNKYSIFAILSYPYPDKYVVKVIRGDGRHVPVAREYFSNYVDEAKTMRLVDRFIKINVLLQTALVSERVEFWKTKEE